MSRNIVIITGTGRNGSTFLMQLLTRLGLDTGWQKDQALSGFINSNSHGGMERDLNGDVPYIVKNPYFVGWIPKIQEKGFVIDHVIVPFREADQAARSRAAVEQRAKDSGFTGKVVPGGFWGASDLHGQKQHILAKTHQLFCSIAEYDLNHTLIHYPRMTEDGEYLFRKLKVLFELSGATIPIADFLHTFQQVVRPELVHRY
jgi:hypothetical protein